MSSIVNEMIAEKLDQVILLLQAQSSPAIPDEKWSALQQEIQAISQRITYLHSQAKSVSQISELVVATARIERSISDLNTKTKTKHAYSFHKSYWISVCLAIIMLAIGWQWLNQKSISKKRLETELKYRYLKTCGSNTVRRFCRRVDSLYLADSKGFLNSLMAAEKKSQTIVESMQIPGKKN